MEKLIEKKAIKLAKNYGWLDIPQGIFETHLTKIRITKPEAKSIIKEMERQGIFKRRGRILRFSY